MSEFIDFVVDSLTPLGAIRVRRMFGSHGVFQDDRMFALIDNDELFFRTDDLSRPAFERRGLKPFEYGKKTGTVKLPYHQAPEEVLDDPDSLCEWGREALAAALRSPLS